MGKAVSLKGGLDVSSSEHALGLTDLDGTFFNFYGVVSDRDFQHEGEVISFHLRPFLNWLRIL